MKITESMNPADNGQPLVMLVDDCEIDNFVNTKMLSRYGFTERIISYESARLAFEYLADPKNEIPAVLFLDLNMPGMDGVGFLEKFKELPQAIKGKCEIVVLSNSYDPRVKENITNNKNVLAFFSKPLIKSNVEELLLKMGRFQVA